MYGAFVPGSEPPRGASALVAPFAVALVGLLWRLWLIPRYFGHEEEDWGNLQIARGVAESGFRWLELDHMPGYSWMVAAFVRLGVDVQTAALGVASVCGAVTVGLVTWLGMRWFDRTTGLVAGLVVAFQPEAALYSATALREAPYTALSVLGILLAGERRWLGAGLALSAAFLVRFNAAFALLPALLLAALWLRRRGEDARGPLLAAALLGATTATWALVYRLHPDGGTWAFWGSVASRNTGGAVADLSGPEHAEAVLEAVFGLALRVFPSHLGPPALLCVPVGIAAVLLALRGRDDAMARQRAWLALCALGTLGLLFSAAAISTYEWFHNLYWKWLTPAVPLLAPLGVHGARVVAARLSPALRRPLIAVLVLATALTFSVQTRAQVRLSASLYGPQVLAARWVEDAFVEDVVVVAAGIPVAWLGRVKSDRVVLEWTDPSVPAGDSETFGRWLFENRVATVFWFAEEWTAAPGKAPFLGRAEATELGPVTLRPVAWSSAYGMVAYAVQQAHGVPAPTHQPPPGTWFPPERP